VGVIVSILQAQMDSIAKVLFFEKKKKIHVFLCFGDSAQVCKGNSAELSEIVLEINSGNTVPNFCTFVQNQYS